MIHETELGIGSSKIERDSIVIIFSISLLAKSLRIETTVDFFYTLGENEPRS